MALLLESRVVNLYLIITIVLVVGFGFSMYFYNRNADSRAAKAKKKMRKTQIAIINSLYAKALENNPELVDQIESQIKDFRNYQTSSRLIPANDNFDSIVYDADEEFDYLISELQKYVDKHTGKELDKAHGTNYFA